MRRVLALILPLLVVLPQQASAQAAGQTTGTITGVVTGEGGIPLTGVIVRVDGSSLAGFTDNNGRYSIAGVPAGTHSLSAEVIGYSTAQVQVTVTAGQQATANIQMTSQAIEVEGLVAVGYGTQRRQDVTGSVATMRMDGVENRVIRGATEALTGQLPGVRVLTPTGAPGSGGVVQIRGLTAVGAGATPLYVIDGFPLTSESATGGNSFYIRSPLADIPPGDIESITVLKDAAAAAIYGSQASNGVVIITTKRGQANSMPRIDVDMKTAFQTVHWDRIPQLTNATEFATFKQRLERQKLWVDRDARQGPIPGPNDPGISPEWRDPASYGEGTNWFREVMKRPEPSHEVTARISGGSEQIRIALSTGYLYQGGLVVGSSYNRMTFRANLDANINQRITLGFALAPTFSARHLLDEGGQSRSGAFGAALHAWPTDSPYNPDGSLKPFIWGSVGGNTLRNPLMTMENAESTDNQLNTLLNAYLDYRIANGLTWRTQLNTRLNSQSSGSYTPSTITNANGEPQNPSITTNHNRSLTWDASTQLDINRDIFEGHRLQATFLVSANRSMSESTSVQKSSGSFHFPDDLVRVIDLASGGSTGWSSSAMASALGRLAYTAWDRYSVTVSLRRDGSSRFGPQNRWGSFPSFAFAWNINNEGFLRDVDWIDELKFRASLGFTGNNQIGNFSHFGNVANSTYNFGFGNANGRGISSLSNPRLGWERTREVNLAVDFTILDGRMSFVTEAYRRVTQDLLLQRNLPRASGFSSVLSNTGSIQNQGFEFGVTSINISRPNFVWRTVANFSINRNKALDLGDSDTLYSGGSMEGAPTHMTVVGNPIGLFVGYRITGIYFPEDIANACSAENQSANCVAIYDGAVPTDVRFKDVNGDGVIRQVEDFEVLGNPWPKFTWGLTNSITYRSFNLNLIIDGQVGGQTTSRNLATIENIDGPFNVSKAYVRTMFIDFDSIGDGMTPSAGASSTGGRRAFRDVNDRWIQNAGFVWVRSLSMGYRLPASLVSSIFRVRSAEVYMSVENPFVWTECFCNPQTMRNSGNPNLQPGFDDNSYPIGRFWSFGARFGI